jgi:hypothetical protein
MNLHPGLRLESATCDTQVVVVRAPKDAEDIDVRCDGVALRPLGSTEERVAPVGELGAGPGTLVGKRYELEDVGLELLCTRSGTGTLTIGDQPLDLKGAKPLPASD